jgi:hypothetical protein
MLVPKAAQATGVWMDAVDAARIAVAAAAGTKPVTTRSRTPEPRL